MASTRSEWHMAPSAHRELGHGPTAQWTSRWAVPPAEPKPATLGGRLPSPRLSVDLRAPPGNGTSTRMHTCPMCTGALVYIAAYALLAIVEPMPGLEPAPVTVSWMARKKSSKAPFCSVVCLACEPTGWLRLGVQAPQCRKHTTRACGTPGGGDDFPGRIQGTCPWHDGGVPFLPQVWTTGEE